MEGKSADATIQLDVDEMILDYLLFTTTKVILEQNESRKGNLSDPQNYGKISLFLQMVKSYLTIFRAIHSVEEDDENISLRLRLLSFVVLFTDRAGFSQTLPSTSALKKLREERQHQASSFRSGDKHITRPNLPNLNELLTPCKTLQEQTFPRASPDATDFLNSLECPQSPLISLLDTLPAFMALSAAQTALQETTITNVWMHLAAGYMVQAVAEQYLVYGSRSSSVFQEAFAWGFDADCTAEEGSDAWQINAMFFGEDEVVTGWDAIRDEHMLVLIPPEGAGLREHLETLLEGDLSTAKFERYIVNFLTGLHLSQPRPLLTQVESGMMDGLSHGELRAFQDVVGLSRSRAPSDD